MINNRDHLGRSALSEACAGNHPDVIEVLARKKAHVNLPDNEAVTPLMVASSLNRLKVVNFLLR